MKSSVLSLFFVLCSFVSFGQCSPDEPFPAFSPYYIAGKGIGIEIGWWGVDASRFGYFAGFEIVQEKITKYDPNKQENVESVVPMSTMFLKGQYRINRYVHVNGLVGVAEFERMVYGAGVRGVVPINVERIAFWAEPQYRTDGARINLGLGFAL